MNYNYYNIKGLNNLINDSYIAQQLYNAITTFDEYEILTGSMIIEWFLENHIYYMQFIILCTQVCKGEYLTIEQLIMNVKANEIDVDDLRRNLLTDEPISYQLKELDELHGLQGLHI